MAKFCDNLVFLLIGMDQFFQNCHLLLLINLACVF